jgi:hypothetical protein
VTRILVLYEDSRSPTGDFGPHEFFLGCVADHTGESVWSLKSNVRAVPVRGVGNLLRHLRKIDQLDALIPGGGPVLAVIDQDRVRDHYKAGTGKATTEVEQQITQECSAPVRLTVVLLERNLESVVEAMRDCGEREHDLLQDALRKNLNERDKLFKRVGLDATRRGIRDCVRARLPGVERIVQRIAAALV